EILPGRDPSIDRMPQVEHTTELQCHPGTVHADAQKLDLRSGRELESKLRVLWVDSLIVARGVVGVVLGGGSSQAEVITHLRSVSLCPLLHLRDRGAAPASSAVVEVNHRGPLPKGKELGGRCQRF
ncbi:hypothetical protein THAOC_26810, partial [Thalassiosira oceanica]